MKYFNLLSKFLLVVCLPVLFLTASIAIAFNSQWVYQRGFNKYDIEVVTGIEKSELKKASQELIRYFNSSEELAEITVIKNGQLFTLFNEKEVLHLKDVKDLVNLDYTALVLSSLYVLGFCAVSLALKPSGQGMILRKFAFGSLLTLLAITATGIIALMDFNWLFLQFHLISFTNDLWLLDPATDYLIMMFPQGFWFDAALLVAGLTAGGALLTGASSLLLASRQQRD
ncbi:MAG: TIGR01906 family membrane protein [Dehalococcoidales bacterium]|nr:TIGR01906 family membrane protein [Dehalococcoidales bacterium]MDD5604719.1 TIGR01906 family membrane protein [Dehalococcoidales bacterium]